MIACECPKMDFEKLIEENKCLKDYFTEFPKKLKQLAIEVWILLELRLNQLRKVKIKK